MKRSMSMTPAPCWFPMTLMALSLWHQMMMASMKNQSRKKKDHQSTECRLPETLSVEETETMTEPIGAEAKT